jgi:HEAT repeats
VRLASYCCDRPSRQTACWLVALVVVSGCESSPSEPNAPPLGAQRTTANPQAIPAKASPAPARPPLHPSWAGTQTWTERETAVDALRRIGPTALPALVELLHGSDRNLREMAARAIALMGPAAKSAIPDLEARLSDLDPEVRKNVIRALGQMGPDAESAIPALVQEIHRPGPAAATPGAPVEPEPSSKFEPPSERSMDPSGREELRAN